MGVLIIGGGLAGLATAVKLKEQDPKREITVLEKISPESNTQISGQRYRARISGQGVDSEAEMVRLLASRNGDLVTDQMRQFARVATAELKAIQDRGIFSQDQPEWFGPQFGRANQAGGGRGKSTLDFFRDLARSDGVTFLKGEATKLIRDGNSMRGVVVGEDLLEDEYFILAGGSLGGRLFNSTNKGIRNTPQELGFEAGFDLVDPTLHMIHPFGNCNREGVNKIGCFETDELEGVSIFYPNGEKDQETTTLLAEHQAHYKFPEISQRFMDRGGVVMMKFPNGSERCAKVSYHYNHLALATEDGIRVNGVNNLLAVGDASGLGNWTEHHTRFPGFALTKCLVDAQLSSDLLKDQDLSSSLVSSQYEGNFQPTFEQLLESQIRGINTKNLFILIFDQAKSKVEGSQRWMDELMELRSGPSKLLDISLGIAEAHLEGANVIRGERCF